MTAPATAGSTLGRYHILKHLASGGMAELFLARATGIEGFERYVVVKKILGDHAKDGRFVKMFLDEARLAAQLHHQNIAQVYDCGQDDGTYYFAMEYVHGENARDVLKKIATLRRQIPLDNALTIIAGAAAGLHHAHERRGADRQPLGIVHRDVSPSNLLVAYDGAVKVCDFGIAKAASRMTETRSGTLKGKIAYMSPEQCLGKSVDRRSDVFALGIVLYELTTVSRLFRGENDYVTMNRIVTGDITPPSKKRADYPPGLEAIVMKALSLDVADRYQTAGEMLEAIEQFCARERIALSAIGLGRFVRELFGERPEPWLDLVGPPMPDDVGAVEVTRSEVGSGVTGIATSAGVMPGPIATPRAPTSGEAVKSQSLVLATSGASSTAETRPRRGATWALAALAAAGAVVLGFAIGRRGDGGGASGTSAPPSGVMAPSSTTTGGSAASGAPGGAGSADVGKDTAKDTTSHVDTPPTAGSDAPPSTTGGSAAPAGSGAPPAPDTIGATPPVDAPGKSARPGSAPPSAAGIKSSQLGAAGSKGKGKPPKAGSVNVGKTLTTPGSIGKTATPGSGSEAGSGTGTGTGMGTGTGKENDPKTLFPPKEE